jgi:hypothetical protein
MPPSRLLLLLASALAAVTQAQAQAQSVPISTSPRPDRVSVTVYRDPDRPAQQPPSLRWLNGFALITETRTVDIPAGEADIRFEGVAGGILPQSAIVTGLPEGVVEKNQDAWLLSPASLIERSLGRRVTLRRTSRATGEVREHEAVIRSGAEGALVLETPEGFEALRCTGLAETVAFDRVPPGLSARPTLSVRTRSGRRARATLTLSYLASGFDWQANYVATLAPDGDRVDLFAWVTLANGDETGFVDAQTQAVAGRLNRRAERRRPRIERPIELRCWPQATTSDIPLELREESITVTGSRISRAGLVPPSALYAPPPPPPAPAAMVAEQEELGDVKLYRIPEPVTVAAHSQKQVAFLQRQGVRAEIVYRSGLGAGQRAWAQTIRVLVARNRSEDGLGVALPAGRLVLFGEGRERPILLGEGSLPDRAVGEEVEVALGPSGGVRARLSSEEGVQILTVSNDQPVPVRYEAQLPVQEVESETELGRRNGMPLWQVTVPANGRATLRYRPSR